MTQLLSLIVILTIVHSFTLFDFHKNSSLNNWKVVDDVVMGGRSSGEFYLNSEGNGVFEGAVSLENNGGFSSLRYNFNTAEIATYSKVCLHLKGDGKEYQFRVKTQSNDYQSYVTSFETSGEWQVIEILLKDLQPTFRGRKLDMPNFSAESMEEIGFLIGNKKAEDFKLEIDKIELK
ncbi:MAG: CIA30 family protein [Chitinophagales bacterium]